MSLKDRLQKEPDSVESAELVCPGSDVLQAEFDRLDYRRRFWRTMLSTVYVLITVAAIAILVATLWLPVLQIYGTSMTPTLTEGDIVISLKDVGFEKGDLVAFYYNNKILVKRVIGGPGDYINIDDDGTVYVNGEVLDEPYLTDRSLGDTDLDYPYQVPEGRYFVMGDHRSTSVDSRSQALGTVAKEQIVGKIVLRIWPLNKLEHF